MKALYLETAHGSTHKKSRKAWRRYCVSLFSIAAALCLSSLVGGVARAQGYLNSIGQATFTAPEPADLGFVETANGNLHMEIPLGTFPQRGSGQPIRLRMAYDSNIWYLNPNYGSPVWQPTNVPGPGAGFNGGWRLIPGDVIQMYSFLISGSHGCTYSNFSWTDARGSIHYFPITTSGPASYGCTNVPNGDALATDSTGYHMYVTGYTNPTVYAPDGTLLIQDPIVQLGTGQFKGEVDSNGNYEVTDQLGGISIDMLGRNLLGSGSGCPGSKCYDLPNSQGTTSRYIVAYTYISANTHFGLSGVTECSTPYCTTIPVIQSISMPDGSIYSFKYDCDPNAGGSNNTQICGSPTGQTYYYATLVSMTLPTGGGTTYAYTTFTDAYGGKGRWLSSRISAGSLWSYTPQVITTCSPSQVGCQQKMTVQKPNGDTTVYTFTLNNGAWPTQVQQYQGFVSAANLLSNSVLAWDFSNSCVIQGCIGAGYIRKLSETTTVPVPGGTSLTKKTAYSYDSPQKGNVSAVQEWKYYPGASPTFPSVPDRATYMTYYSAGNNIINKPLSVTLCNNSGTDANCPGGGSKVTQTMVTYDSYGANGLTSVTGVTNHDDVNFGSGNTARGNATSIQQWVSGSTYLTTQLQYDTTGQVLEVIDPKLNATIYSYADNFFNDNGSNPPQPYTPPTPTNAYVTSETLPLIGRETIGYYFGKGKAAVLTDQNGAMTYSHYLDPLDRATQTNFPVGWSQETYTSPTQSDTYIPVAGASPSSGCLSCRDNQINLDGWGRKVNEKLANAPGGAINVDTTYDINGRVQSVSHAYVSRSDPSYVFETFSYDGLDRQIAVTHPDNQSAFEAYGSNVSNLAGVITQQSSVTTYGYGYPLASLDESGKQRQQWIDGVGHIIEVDEPSINTGTAGAASVTGNGYEQVATVDPCYKAGYGSCPYTVYDYGYVSVIVNGFTASVSYNSASTLSGVINGLTFVLNSASSPVTASINGSTIKMTAKGNGASTNFSFTTSAATGDPTDFYGPSFWVTPSSGSLTGGSGGISVSPLVTTYTYNAAGNLTQVNQGLQTRTFTYDGLGRPTSRTTPEAGTEYFYYTMSDNLTLCAGSTDAICRRADARGITTTYSYDSLSRLTGKTYSNGQGAVAYQYDQGGAGAFALGRLTSVTDPSGSETYTYNPMGWITQLQKVVGTTTYNIGYQYNPGGQVTQITYPSGRIVQQTPDNIGRLQTVASGGTNYVSVPSSGGYNAAGQVLSMNYGNGVAASFGYSSSTRDEMTSLSYTNGTNTLFNLNYYYQNVPTNCAMGTTGNNGQIQCIVDATPIGITPGAAGRTINYTYDALGRLATAVTTGSAQFAKWGISETYDRYGNRTNQTVTAGSAPANSLSFATTPVPPTSPPGGAYTNRPDGYSFDASGNMLNDGINTLTYDAENCLLSNTNSSTGTTNYTCDAAGVRVKKALQGGTTTVYIFDGDLDIAEYNNGAAPGSPSREFLYAGSNLVASITGSNTIYHHRDHLSVRLYTDANGQVTGQQATYPFGESWYSTSAPDQFVFTTYQRDSESGNDYAMARYYIDRFGRFCSADPLMGNPGDPQSWDRFAYVRNDPINKTDPGGQSWVSWLIDALAVAAAIILPEVAPSLFSFSGETTTWTVGDLNMESVSANLVGQAAGPATLSGTQAATLTVTSQMSTISFAAAAGLPQGNPFSNTPQFQGAKDLLQKPKCANWLTSLAQKAAAVQKEGALTPQESQYYADQIKSIPNTLDTTATTYQQTVNPINSEGYQTNAEVNYNSNPQSMTLYKGFFNQEFLGSQSQIVLHEGVHLVTHFGDRALARAATGKNYPATVKGNSQASQDWHGQLKNNCNY